MYVTLALLGTECLLVMVETELACSLSSTLSGKDSLEIGSSVEAILSEESFVSVETGLVKKLSIVYVNDFDFPAKYTVI
jgi:hypothetical protein